MLSVFEVAKYFLSLVDEDEGELMSHLKLQKLVYYAQGFHLAVFDAPLFPEKIKAWTHGPVVPELYNEYKRYGNMPIPAISDIDLSQYTEEVKGLLDEIYDVYGQYSAWKLANLTHEEPPYTQTLPNQEIRLDLMRDYFQTQINK